MHRRRWLRRVEIGFFALLWIAFALFIGAFLIWPYILVSSWPHPDPKTGRGMEELRGMARTSVPLIAAIDRYRHDHGRLPESLSDLFSGYLTRPSPKSDDPDRWREWGYQKVDRMTFRLAHKINWDAFMTYTRDHPDRGQWEYESGNGSGEPPTVIVPLP